MLPAASFLCDVPYGPLPCMLIIAPIYDAVNPQRGFLPIPKSGQALQAALKNKGKNPFNRLHSTCKAIQGEPFNESSYRYMIEKTYKKYSIPEKMLRDVNPQNIFMLIKQGV
jgi:hypothetical protein